MSVNNEIDPNFPRFGDGNSKLVKIGQTWFTDREVAAICDAEKSRGNLPRQSTNDVKTPT